MYRNILSVIMFILVLASLLLGPAKGITFEEAKGWLVEGHTTWYGRNKKIGKRHQLRRFSKRRWVIRSKSWHVPLLRSLILWALWQLSGQIGPDWLQLLPWLIWLLPADQKPLGRIQQKLWQVQRILLLGYAGLSAYHLLELLLNQNAWGVGLLGCAVCDAEPSVAVKRTEDGYWQADLSGHFTLRVSDEHPFRLRLLLIFLGLLQSDNDERHSRRTRDGRTPFARQEQLADWTNTKQEHISLWMLAGRRLGQSAWTENG